MKKVLVLTALSLMVANAAFATSLATTAPTAAAASVFGGVDAAAALVAPTPLIKFSTGVRGIVNFSGNTEYLIATKHDSGNKIFGTNNLLTNIYWKQSTSGALTTTNFTPTTAASSNFVGGGWTSY